MSRPLNPKQLKFVELYLATGNATKSYADAYDQPNRQAAQASSVKLLSNALVRQAIDNARAKSAATQGITAEWYAARVKLEAEREGDGASHSARVSALKLAGDLLGVGELHKHQHSGPGFGAIPLANLSDADLDQLDALLSRAALPPPADPGDGQEREGEAPG